LVALERDGHATTIEVGGGLLGNVSRTPITAITGGRVGAAHGRSAACPCAAMKSRRRISHPQASGSS